MTEYPHIVAEYIQFDDVCWFDPLPLQLYCAINDLVQTKSMYGKTTVIKQYWICNKHDCKQAVFYFRLGSSIAINSIIGIPTIKVWKSVFDFTSDKLVTNVINTCFPFVFESTKNEISSGIINSVFELLYTPNSGYS